MKNQNSIYGYLIVAIIGALFCFLILNALGWQKPVEAEQDVPAISRMTIDQYMLFYQAGYAKGRLNQLKYDPDQHDSVWKADSIKMREIVKPLFK